jgi:DNA-binding transcriptional MerR regulator
MKYHRTDMNDDPLLKIGEIAAFFNVSVKAMRIYERMEILKPVKVDEATGYRYYSAGQVRQLDALIELRGLGFSLAEIKELLTGDVSSDRYMEALTHKKMYWQQRIDAAQDKISSIDEQIMELNSGTPSTKLHDLTDDERANLLSKMVCIEDLNARTPLSEALWL